MPRQVAAAPQDDGCGGAAVDAARSDEGDTASKVLGKELVNQSKQKGGRLTRTTNDLLDRGASPGEKDKHGRTPLHHAAENDRVEVARLLLARRADVRVRDTKGGHSPLDLALEWDHLEVARTLLTQHNDEVAGTRVKEEQLVKLVKEEGPEGTAILELLAPQLELPDEQEEKTGQEEEEGDDNGSTTVATPRSLRGSASSAASLDENAPAWLHYCIGIGDKCVEKPRLPAEACLRGRLRAFLLPGDPLMGWKSIAMDKRIGRLEPLVAQSEKKPKWTECDKWWESVFPVRTVPAILCVLAFTPKKECCTRKVMEAVRQTSNMNSVATTFVEAAVTETWKEWYPWAYFDILISTLTVACAASVSTEVLGDEANLGDNRFRLVFLTASTVKRVLEEVCQMLQPFGGALSGDGSHNDAPWFYTLPLSTYEYLKKSWRDCLNIFCSVQGLRVLFSGGLDPEKRFRLSLWFGLLWLQLLYRLRIFQCVGVSFLPIFHALLRTGPFFLVFGFCLVAGTHAYYILALRLDEPSPLYAALIQVLRLGVLGDFDRFEFEGVAPVFRKRDGADVWEPEDPPPSDAFYFSHVIFILIAGVVTVLLMNLLIGVLGASYNAVEGIAQQLYIRELAGAIVDYHSYPWARLFKSCLEKCWRKGSEEGLFIYALVSKNATDDTSKSVQALLEKASKSARATDEKLERLAKTAEKLEKLTEDNREELRKLAERQASERSGEKRRRWPRRALPPLGSAEGETETERLAEAVAKAAEKLEKLTQAKTKSSEAVAMTEESLEKMVEMIELLRITEGRLRNKESALDEIARRLGIGMAEVQPHVGTN